MSMISELIEELIDNADLYTKELHDLMYRAADTIGMLSEKVRESKQEWTPCSEGMPKRQGYYSCTCKDGSKYKRTTVVKWSNGWQLTGARAYWIVLAWMPLPDPWKGADDE